MLRATGGAVSVAPEEWAREEVRLECNPTIVAKVFCVDEVEFGDEGADCEENGVCGEAMECDRDDEALSEGTFEITAENITRLRHRRFRIHGIPCKPIVVTQWIWSDGRLRHVAGRHLWSLTTRVPTTRRRSEDAGGGSPGWEATSQNVLAGKCLVRLEGGGGTTGSWSVSRWGVPDARGGICAGEHRAPGLPAEQFVVWLGLRRGVVGGAGALASQLWKVLGRCSRVHGCMWISSDSVTRSKACAHLHQLRSDWRDDKCDTENFWKGGTAGRNSVGNTQSSWGGVAVLCSRGTRPPSRAG